MPTVRAHLSLSNSRLPALINWPWDKAKLRLVCKHRWYHRLGIREPKMGKLEPHPHSPHEISTIIAWFRQWFCTCYKTRNTLHFNTTTQTTQLGWNIIRTCQRLILKYKQNKTIEHSGRHTMNQNLCWPLLPLPRIVKDNLKITSTGTSSTFTGHAFVPPVQ